MLHVSLSLSKGWEHEARSSELEAHLRFATAKAESERGKATVDKHEAKS